MIKKITLHNWKSFEHSTLYVDSLTFLIGTNASGKSNILDAFSFLNRIAHNSRISEAISEIRGGENWIIRKNQSEFYIEIVYDDGKKYDYTYRITIRKQFGDVYELRDEKLSRINHLGKQISKDLFYTNNEKEGDAIIPCYFHTGKRGKQRKISFNRSYSVISQIEVGSLVILKDVKESALLVLSAMKNIFILDPIPNHMRQYSSLSDTLLPDASNIAGVLSALPEDVKDSVEKRLTTFVKPLPEKDICRVWAEPVGRFKKDAMLYCEEEWTNSNHIEMDARGMSDGTLRFIAIITALLTGKPNSLLIVEEIDNGLHPSRSHELIKVLKTLGTERKIDVLCTTHNPALIDALGHQMIPFISYVKRNASDGTSVIELLEEKNDLAKCMASSSIGDLMTNGKI